MKRSIFLLPLSLILTVSLSSCSEAKKITLSYGQMISEEFTAITYDELATKINDKSETFALTVYANNCSCWSIFKSIINKYVAETHAKIYAIPYSSFRSSDGTMLNNFDLKLISGSVTFHLIENGKIFNEISDSKSQIIKKYETFTEYMNEYVNLPKKYYVSLEQVNSLYKSEETSLIYFARSNCGDCQYLDTSFLNSYVATNNLYILDCENINIRKYDEEGNLTPESQIKWNEFKVNYGLAKDKNETYGYDTGYVPTLLLVKGDGESALPTFLSGAVYFNDTIAKDDAGYYIENSYYTSERVANLSYTSTILKNKRLSDDEVTSIESYTFWNQIDAAEVYNPLIKAFLDESLTKVTHEGFNK